MISNINNGESGSSARGKINSAIDQLNTSIISLPIVRYVYLVADAADATAMGGSTKNVYTTMQAAYDAANTIQTALSVIVVIKVGNTTAATTGNLTLTANYNQSIHWVGLSRNISNIGNIIATNSAGNGYDVVLTTANVRFGSVTTSATGVTGNSGTLTINSENSLFTTLTTSISNASNTTGNGGNVTFQGANLNPIIGFSFLNTSAKGASAFAGNFTVNSISSLYAASVTTAQNNLGGVVSITLNGSGLISSLIINNNDTASINLLTTYGCDFSNFSVTGAPQGNISITKSRIISNATITNNGTGITNVTLTNTLFLLNYTTNANTKTIMRLSNIGGSIVNLGDNSIISNCSIGTVGGSGIVINGIGTGCKIYCSTILDGTTSIYNSSAVTVKALNLGNAIIASVDANVTLD